MFRIPLGVFGVVTALCSAFFVATALGEMVTGGDGRTSFGVYLGLFVFFLGTGVMGTWLAYANLWRRQVAPRRASTAAEPGANAVREDCILGLAQQEHGRVTVAEVASHCNLTVADAKAALDQMVLQKVAEMHVTENGVLVYVFDGFLSDDEKARAANL
ncbi:MAG: hypothetical protein IT305_22680 [Chloroflexi bacterium]|nr:hypothetical protein [Chloroflexota bacterium]